MEIKKIYNLIADSLAKKGFKKIYIDTFNPYFKWTFDIFAESQKAAIGLEFRKNETISEVFINNVLSIKKFSKKLFIYVVFERKPSFSIIHKLSKIGIGVMIFRSKQLFKLTSSREFSGKPLEKKVTHKKQKTMPQFFLYPSSPLYENMDRFPCKERQMILKIVHDFNRQYSIPIHAKQPEKDTRFGNNFKKCMKVNIQESQIFVGVIKEEWRKNVEFEVQHAFKEIDNNCIVFLRKNIPESKFDEKQKKLINFIQKYKKHLPYSILNDFEDTLTPKLIEIINLLYHNHHMKSPFETLPNS